jgi:hypothetical protein
VVPAATEFSKSGLIHRARVHYALNRNTVKTFGGFPSINFTVLISQMKILFVDILVKRFWPLMLHASDREASISITEPFPLCHQCLLRDHLSSGLHRMLSGEHSGELRLFLRGEIFHIASRD